MNSDKAPTLYHIRLRGVLDLERAAWFPELSITEDMDGNSLLVGDLSDQSALLGVLSRVHNLNLYILSLEVKEEK